MALTVQTNVGAISALKNLNINALSMNRSLERLSSGFRINSAADDAAGYAVSTKLNGQRGKLEAASQNALQATAMVKMADAGVNEIENMVRRMQALATQAASDTISSTERSKLEAERAKLEGQIDNIATSTNYNGTSLIDGASGISVTGTLDDTTTNGVSSIAINGASASTTFTVSYVDQATATTFDAGDSIRITDGTTSQTIAVSSLPTGQSTSELSFGDLGITLTINSAISGTTTASGTGSVSSTGTIITSSASASSIQVGADNAADNRVSVDFSNSYKATDLNSGFASGNISTQSAARTYIDDAAAALNTLTTNRAALGSVVNQLGYVSANLATSIEQLSSAISTIKDADMAKEMANFTKSQVLVQAGTAMLAQANQASQNVLALFR